jgi:hypothetical protein
MKVQQKEEIKIHIVHPKKYYLGVLHYSSQAALF